MGEVVLLLLPDRVGLTPAPPTTTAAAAAAAANLPEDGALSRACCAASFFAAIVAARFSALAAYEAAVADEPRLPAPPAPCERAFVVDDVFLGGSAEGVSGGPPLPLPLLLLPAGACPEPAADPMPICVVMLPKVVFLGRRASRPPRLLRVAAAAAAWAEEDVLGPPDDEARLARASLPFEQRSLAVDVDARHAAVACFILSACFRLSLLPLLISGVSDVSAQIDRAVAAACWARKWDEEESSSLVLCDRCVLLSCPSCRDVGARRGWPRFLFFKVVVASCWPMRTIASTRDSSMATRDDEDEDEGGLSTCMFPDLPVLITDSEYTVIQMGEKERARERRHDKVNRKHGAPPRRWSPAANCFLACG